MPQERLTTPALHQTQCGASVRKIREILRLKWELKLSERVIARSCCISRSTVAEYVKRAEAAGLKWPLPGDQSDNQLYELMCPRTQQLTPKATTLPDWEEVHLELRKKGGNAKFIVVRISGKISRRVRL